MGTHTEPTPGDVGAFMVLLTGLVSASQEMGARKVIHQAYIDGVSKGTEAVAQAERSAERVDLAKLGLEAQWEAVQAWLADHMPEGNLPESCRRG